MIRRLGRWFGIAAAVLLCAAASTPTTTPSSPTLAELMEPYQRPESIPFPPDDPYSEAKEQLGRMLFFDPILSGTRNVSCASCHNPGLSWADGRKLAAGVGQMELHTPTLIDVAWVPGPGWDGKYRSLESVAFGPLLAPLNMNNTEPEIISRLTGIPGYVQAFDQAFPGAATEAKITRPHIEQAIATFERTIQAAHAPFDRWIAGDETAISE